MWFYYCGSEGFFFLFLVPLQIVVNTRKFILSNKCVPNNHAEILFLIRWKAYLCYIYRTFHFSHSRQTQISRWKPYGNMAKNTRIQKCFGGIKKFRLRTENRFRYIRRNDLRAASLKFFAFIQLFRYDTLVSGAEAKDKYRPEQCERLLFLGEHTSTAKINVHTLRSPSH